MENTFKVKVICDGEIVNAKYFKNLTDVEKSATTGNLTMWNPHAIFIEPTEYSSENEWLYMYNTEVIILEEN